MSPAPCHGLPGCLNAPLTQSLHRFLATVQPGRGDRREAYRWGSLPATGTSQARLFFRSVGQATEDYVRRVRRIFRVRPNSGITRPHGMAWRVRTRSQKVSCWFAVHGRLFPFAPFDGVAGTPVGGAATYWLLLDCEHCNRSDRTSYQVYKRVPSNSWSPPTFLVVCALGVIPKRWRHSLFIKESAIAQRSRLDSWSDGRATTRLPIGSRRPGLQRCPSPAPDGHASLKRSGQALMRRLTCRSRSPRFLSCDAVPGQQRRRPFASGALRFPPSGHMAMPSPSSRTSETRSASRWAPWHW